MNWDIVQSLGVGGTFCVVVLYLVFDFLGKRKTNNPTVSVNKNCTGDYITRRECDQTQKTIEVQISGLKELTETKFKSVEGSLEEVKTLIKNGNK